MNSHGGQVVDRFNSRNADHMASENKSNFYSDFSNCIKMALSQFSIVVVLSWDQKNKAGMKDNS